MLCVLTGVAGSGKSSLIQGSVAGRDGVVVVDQGAIRGSRRSNPATYSGLLEPIRKAFAKANGVKPALFSSNSEGACPACNGAGVIYTELGVMATVATTCEECEGKRFQASVLEYTLGGRNIAEVLAMPVSEAAEFFADGEAATPAAHKILDRLADVGLGYLTLGQPLTTLSGGERQRLKLAAQMAAKGDVYVLDEPTTGLHLADVENLLGLLDRLVDSGKSVARHRAPPGGDGARRLDHRPRSRSRPRRRPGRLPGPARRPGRPPRRRPSPASTSRRTSAADRTWHVRAQRSGLDHPSGRRGHCMRAIVLSGALALVGTLLGTRVAIGWFTRHGFGQPIRVDGPTTHHVKRGTPTMGGVVIVLGSTAAYLTATILTGNRPSASAWLLLLLFAGCGVVGFLDDFIKVYRQHNQGLRSGAKMAGQTAVALSFGILATQFFADDRGVRPASQHISTTQDWGIKLPLVVVLLVIWFIVTAASNGANLTDGADGLLAGISAMVFGGLHRGQHLAEQPAVRFLAAHRGGVAVLSGA